MKITLRHYQILTSIITQRPQIIPNYDEKLSQQIIDVYTSQSTPTFTSNKTCVLNEFLFSFYILLLALRYNNTTTS